MRHTAPGRGRTGWKIPRWIGPEALAMPLAGLALGCGMMGSPQPPSLELPRPVHDLTAQRIGAEVRLGWTTPRETTDRMRLRQPVTLRVCRELQPARCETVATLHADPGQPGSYLDRLPADASSGPLRAMVYRVTALNRSGRDAGPSNRAATLAGMAPPPVERLSAAMTERGVVLRWQPQATAGDCLRLDRTLVAAAAGQRGKGLPAVSESTEQGLRVSLAGGDPGTALDPGAAWDRTYRYTAERMVEVGAGAARVKIAGAPAEAVVVSTRDVFPPAIPAGLAAVPLAAAINDGVAEVDLSWSANAEPDFDHYLVFRRDSSAAAAARALQIAPAAAGPPVVAPEAHDRDVAAGRTYAYSVAAVDHAGNRSARSAEVLVAVPVSNSSTQ